MIQSPTSSRSKKTKTKTTIQIYPDILASSSRSSVTQAPPPPSVQPHQLASRDAVRAVAAVTAPATISAKEVKTKVKAKDATTGFRPAARFGAVGREDRDEFDDDDVGHDDDDGDGDGDFYDGEDDGLGSISSYQVIDPESESGQCSKAISVRFGLTNRLKSYW